MNWNALTPAQIRKNTTPDAWNALYEQVAPALEVALSVLRLDFKAFGEQSGKHILALLDSRRKTKDSFSTKACTIARNQDRLDRLPSHRALTIFDLVTDMVGGRMVFYFERDIKEAVLFWMTFPMYFPLEVTQWVQDVSGYDSDLIAPKRWIDSLKSDEERRRPNVKRSGYESLHFIVGIDVDLLLARCEVARHRSEPRSEKDAGLLQLEDLIKRYRGIIEKIRLEVQCRTLLEHTWAEVEHRARYSAIKSGQATAQSHDDQQKAFRSYKAALRAAQIFQNGLYSDLSRWDHEDAVLSGRSTSVELFDRASFWGGDQLALITKLNRQLTETVDSVRRDSSSNDRRERDLRAIAAWDGMFQLFLQTRAELSLENLHVSVRNEEDYGKRRVLLLILGFIMSYGRGTADSRKTWAEVYLKGNVPDDAIKCIAPAVTAARLYEHVKLLDGYFSRGDPRSHFFDPLVEARAASVYFRHFGSLRRSSALLGDTIKRFKDWDNPHKNHSLVLSEKYLRHRLVENAWAAYNLEGKDDADLESASDSALEALDSHYPANSQPEASEIDSKLIAHILTIELYRGSTLTAQGERPGEASWEILRNARRAVAIERIWDTRVAPWLHAWDESTARGYSVLQVAQDVFGLARVAPLRMQGLAIALVMRAATEDNRGRDSKVDKLLVGARRTVRAARVGIAKRVAEQIGGALPFHEAVVREVEGFIYSLCVDDRVSSRKAATQSRRKHSEAIT